MYFNSLIPPLICISSSPTVQPSPSPSSTTHPSLLVKVRVCGSGECDFVEVEVGPVTYSALLTACCEELEVATGDVAKIRKLPNILVRKDRDVQRMKDGQELEVVLKNENTAAAANVISPPASFPTSMLTVNPFTAPNAAVLALSNHGVVQQRNDAVVSLKPDETNSGNVPGLVSDTSTEGHNHTHSSGAVNGVQ